VDVMISLYHGTTEENCRSILENGFTHDTVVWTCSDPNVMYFYDQRMVAREYDLTPQEAKELCFEFALQSAFTTGALTNSQSRNLFVVEVQIPDRRSDIISLDRSTGDWNEHSVCVPTIVLDQFPCSVYAALDCYSPRLAALYLCSLAHKEHLADMNLTKLEQAVIKRLDKAALEPFLDTLNEFFTQPKLVRLHHDIRVGQVQRINEHIVKALAYYDRFLERQEGWER